MYTLLMSMYSHLRAYAYPADVSSIFGSARKDDYMNLLDTLTSTGASPGVYWHIYSGESEESDV